MFGYILAGLAGALAAGIVRRAVWHHHGAHRGWRGRGFRRYALNALFERLDATPGQEKVIQSALDEVQTALHEARAQALSSRSEVAATFQQPSVSEQDVKELLAGFDAPLEAVRQAAGRGLTRIHEALDERQRGLLADLLAHGPGRMAWRHPPGCGMHRACAAPAC